MELDEAVSRVLFNIEGSPSTMMYQKSILKKHGQLNHVLSKIEKNEALDELVVILIHNSVYLQNKTIEMCVQKGSIDRSNGLN